MMFSTRTSIVAELEVVSDLHIGVSDSAQDASGRQYAPVVRDVNGKPIIPASSLKGALRSAEFAVTSNDESDVFGFASRHREGEGQIANLWLEHAVLKKASSEDLNSVTQSDPEGGVFRAWHVALDPKTGAAKANHLFQLEKLARGSAFSFKADWLGSDLDKLADVLRLLLDGIHLGRANSKGAGLVRLNTDTLQLFEHKPDADGKLNKVRFEQNRLNEFIAQINAVAPADLYETFELSLQATGPFISVLKTRDNEMQPLARNGRPYLWTQSLAGALRSKARWLAEVNRARGIPDIEREKQIPMDDPKLETALDGAKKIREVREVKHLSAVEKLFGVTGYQARLRIKSIECTDAGPRRIKTTSNSIDRLTGATREGALFSKSAFWQPRFKAVLEIRRDDENIDFLKKLLSELEADCLELGHGASMGFGWFEVKLEEPR